MLYRAILTIFLFVTLSSCAPEKERLANELKDIMVDYNKKVIELEKFYQTDNLGKKTSKDISVVNGYYSKTLVLVAYAKKNGPRTLQIKKRLRKLKVKSSYRLPRMFTKNPTEIENIRVEINRRLGMVIARLSNKEYSHKKPARESAFMKRTVTFREEEKKEKIPYQDNRRGEVFQADVTRLHKTYFKLARRRR